MSQNKLIKGDFTMKKVKSIIAIILCMLTLFSTMSISVSAASVSVGTAKTGTSATYTIKNSGSGKMLNVYGSKSASNTNVTVYQSDGTKGQKCKFISNGTMTYNKVSYNKYIIEFACASSCALNVYGSSSANNSNVNIWKKSGNTTQAWILEYVTSPAKGYIIRSANNPKYVLTANGTSNSSNVCLKTYSATNKNQVWTCDAFSHSTKNTASSTTTSSAAASSGKITTEQIRAVCNKYGYTSGKYWTMQTNTNYPGYSNCANANYKGKSCVASTIPQGGKDANGKKYMSYNYNNTWECCGFASFIMHEVTGKELNARGSSATAQNGWKVYKSTATAGCLKVGDIIRYNGHSAIVYTVDSKGNATFVEVWGGKDCIIKINSGFNTSTGTRTLSYFNNSNLTYIYRYEG